MPGSKAEAEDAVQDAYHVDAGSINSVEAWLVDHNHTFVR